MPMPDLPPPEKLDPAERWKPWKPGPDDPWGPKWAAHLYRRAGFGHTPAELKQAVGAGLDATLDRLAGSGAQPQRPVEKPTPAAADLRAWWLGRMLSGVEPLRERLTFFWHNHFATSINKVAEVPLMKRQNELLRIHALGKFGPMLRAVSRDPAMLIWLDSNENVKAKPNENYAREVMELFSLGVGNYTEKDVREAARAFTGWHVTPKDDINRRYTFVEAEHDPGRKTVLGQSGDWDGDDVIRILLEQPACARLLVRKLYTFLVSETPPPDALLEPLAVALRENDYDLSVPVMTILRSRHFFSPYAYRQRVQGPVEYAVAVGRLFGVGPAGGFVLSPYTLVGALELMGQQLFAPPNVKGWEGGRSWLNTATVLARHNFAHAVSQGMGELNQTAARLTGQGFLPSVDPLALARRAKVRDAETVVRFYGDLLLPGDLREEVRKKLVAHVSEGDPENYQFELRARDALYVLLTLPEYQLN